MTPEQKDEILRLVIPVDQTVRGCGYFNGKKQYAYEDMNDKAWEGLKRYLTSITEPEDGLLEGESIRCNIDPLPIKNNFKGFGCIIMENQKSSPPEFSKLVNDHFWELS